MMTSGATQELVFCALQPHAESKIHNLTDKCVFRFLESNTRPQLILPVSDYFRVLFRYLKCALDSSQKLGGKAEYLIDGTCSFDFKVARSDF